MTDSRSLSSGLDTDDLGFGIATLGLAVLVLPVQFVSILAFDATGLDTITPGVAFVTILPAVVVACVPGALAAKRYSGSTAVVVALGAVAVYVAVAAYGSGMYGACGGESCTPVP